MILQFVEAYSQKGSHMIMKLVKALNKVLRPLEMFLNMFRLLSWMFLKIVDMFLPKPNELTWYLDVIA